MVSRRRGTGRPKHGGQVIIHTDRVAAVVFDIDGVVKDTASVRADAWAQLFDGFPPGSNGQPPAAGESVPA